MTADRKQRSLLCYLLSSMPHLCIQQICWKSLGETVGRREASLWDLGWREGGCELAEERSCTVQWAVFLRAPD